MQGEKKWYESKTILSGISVTLISSFKILAIIFPEIQTSGALNIILDTILVLAGLVGVGGRIVATQRIQ